MWKRLMSGSGAVLLSRLAGAGVMFTVQALLARYFGEALLGQYMIAIAAMSLCAMVMPLGFQTIGTYFLAEYRAKGQGQNLRHFLLHSYGHVIGIFGLLLFFGRYVVLAFGGALSGLADYWSQICVMAFATALVFISGSLLVAFKRPIVGFLADAFFRPMVMMASVVLVLIYGTPPDAMIGRLLWLMAIGSLVIALIHAAIALVSAREISTTDAPDPRQFKRWWRFALPWTIIALCTDFFFDIDLLLLSQLLDAPEIAIFGVATRMFALASFAVSAVYATSLPEVFEADAAQDEAGFARKILETNLVATAAACAALLASLVFAPYVLQLFGTKFVDGANVLAILCGGLVVRSALGPTSLLLSLHNRPYATLPSVALGMVVLVLANNLLVPDYGMHGAAWAAVCAITIWSVAMWATAKILTGRDVSIAAYFKLL